MTFKLRKSYFPHPGNRAALAVRFWIRMSCLAMILKERDLPLPMSLADWQKGAIENASMTIFLSQRRTCYLTLPSNAEAAAT